MARYPTPADALRAANDSGTPEAELRGLANSPHAFVRAALAGRADLPADLVPGLVPAALATSADQELAQRLVAHPRATAAIRAQIASRLDRLDDADDLVAALARSDVPFAALAPVLARANAALRRRLEKETTRDDVREALRAARERNRAAAPPPPAPAPRAAPPVDDAPWERVLAARRDRVRAALAGAVLRRDDNHFDRDLSGGSGFSETARALALGPDGAFRYEESRSVSISAAGLSLQSPPRRTVEEGRWSVATDEGRTVLVLRRADGSEVWRARVGDDPSATVLLDGEPWRRSGGRG